MVRLHLTKAVCGVAANGGAVNHWHFVWTLVTVNFSSLTPVFARYCHQKLKNNIQQQLLGAPALKHRLAMSAC